MRGGRGKVVERPRFGRHLPDGESGRTSWKGLWSRYGYYNEKKKVTEFVTLSAPFSQSEPGIPVRMLCHLRKVR